jgi:hypothetical protein
MGLYWQGPHDDNWYLYDDANGRTKLVRRWRSDYEHGTIQCPDCDEPLMFERYRAKCPECGEEFRSGWGQVYRVKPFNVKNERGRGWKNLRLYAKRIEVRKKSGKEWSKRKELPQDREEAKQRALHCDQKASYLRSARKR